MATFSWKKNPKVLANNFAKNFKSFESYMKHCVNGLKRINWFKAHQFDNNISDYDYMEKFLQTEGFNVFDYLAVFDMYGKMFLDKLDKNNFITIKTNEYYYDNASKFIEKVSYFKENLINNNNTSLSNLNYEQNYYKQLCHTVETVNFEIDYDKCYTNKEIMDLIMDNKIFIIESFTIKSNLSEFDILEKQYNGEIVLKSIDFGGRLIGFGVSGDISGYVEATSKEEKKEWIIKNMLMLKWIRNNIITFNSVNNEIGIHLNIDFYNILQHINLLSNAMEKHYKSKNKDIPQNYLSLISKIKINALQEKEVFEIDNQKIIGESFDY